MAMVVILLMAAALVVILLVVVVVIAIMLMAMPFIFQTNIKIISIQSAFPGPAKVKLIAVHSQTLQGLCKSLPICSQV